MTILVNKVAIVTGASTGIGYATALATLAFVHKLVDGGVSINRV